MQPQDTSSSQSNPPQNGPPPSPNQAGDVINPSAQPADNFSSASASAPAVSAGSQTAFQSSVLSPQPIISSSSKGEQAQQKPPRRFKPSKKLTVVLATVLVLLGASAAAYFGYYVPNKPENIWRTALERTGKGYDKLVGYVNTAKYDKGLKYDGSFKVDATELKADGNIKGSSDDQGNSQTSGSISAVGLKVNFNLLTLASQTSVPDLYFKVDGIQGLGSFFGVSDPNFNKAFDSINGQWYFVDHTLLEQSSSADKNQLSISKKDVNDFLNAIGGPTKKYIFTSDTQNMGVVAREQIGREKEDGLNTYHYKVGINKANIKKWNTEVCDNLKDNKLYKTLSFGQDQATIDKECYDTSDIDKLKDSQTADVWVDLHTKLVHKVRFTDSKQPSNYVDVIQNYQGGNKVPLALDFVENLAGETSKGLVNIEYNADTSAIKLTSNFSVSGKEGGTGSIDFTISPNYSAVNVKKPAGAKNVMQLINSLGLSDLSLGGTQSSSKDTERRTDLNALSGQLEVYYTDSGSYPTLANLNDASWRKTNLQGFDDEALKDPDATSPALVSKPQAKAYAYQPAPVGCSDNCSSYTLTATLSDGTPLVKRSLN